MRFPLLHVGISYKAHDQIVAWNNTINTNKTELNNSINTKAPLASPTFTGSAKVAAGTDYTTAKLRNVILSTANPSGGNNGDIWIKYKA